MDKKRDEVKPAKLIAEGLEALGKKDEDKISSLLHSIKERKKELLPAIMKKLKKKEEPALILKLVEKINDPDFGKAAGFIASGSTFFLSLRLKAVELAETLEVKLGPGLSSDIREGAKLLTLILQAAEGELKTLSSRVKELPLDIKLSLVSELASAPEKAVPVFSLLLGEKRELDERIYQMLKGIETTSSLALLSSELEKTDEKERLKLIKKAIHRLKSKGIELQKEKPKEKEKSEEEEGYLSTIDPLGERLLILVMPKARGEIRFFQVITSDAKGILHFITHSVPYEELISSIKRAEYNKGIHMAKAPADYIRTLIEQYASINEKRGEKPPAEFISWRNWMGKPKEEFDKPLIYRFISEEDIAVREALSEQGERLFKAPGISGWVIPEEEIKEGFARFTAAEESQLVLSDLQKEERRGKIILAEAERYFTNDKKELYKKRLSEMSYLLYQRGMKLEAEIALATARALSSRDIKFIPFALTLIRRSIEYAVKKKKEEEKKEPRLIIPPSAGGQIGEKK
jgi:hypothetical protein